MNEQSTGSAASLTRLVSQLLAELDGTAVTECEFRSGTQHILVRRSLALAGRPTAPQIEEDDVVPAHWQIIVAPLTGVFYVSENPQVPPFVTEGGVISPGQRVGLIESMKMFNPVESEFAGTVRAILVANGAEVQVGQALIYVEPVGDPFYEALDGEQS